MTITIMNIRSYRDEGVYVGRRNVSYGVEGSVLANPFNMRYEVERDQVIADYETWLTERMKSDTPQRREVIRLRKLYKRQGELKLICWCAPKKCHAEVIKRFIEEVK